MSGHPKKPAPLAKKAAVLRTAAAGKPSRRKEYQDILPGKVRTLPGFFIFYMLMIYPTAPGAEAFWYAKDDGNCYPNGYAIIDSERNENKDFIFVIFGKNTATSVVPDTTTDDTATSDDTVNDTADDSSTSTITAPKVTTSANKQSAQAKELKSNPPTQADIDKVVD